MKVILDYQILHRRARLSHIASLGGLLILLGSVALSLWQPSWNTISAIMLFTGFAVSVTGIYYANRWVKKPRPEEVLNEALKGLNDQYRLYHYVLPCDHLLLTPSSLVVIETVALEGYFSYHDGHWKQNWTFSRALRFFVEEKLGDPTARAISCSQMMKEHLVDKIPEAQKIDARAIVVFTNPYAELDIEKAPITICKPNKLRRRLNGEKKKISIDLMKQVQVELDRMAKLEITSNE